MKQIYTTLRLCHALKIVQLKYIYIYILANYFIILPEYLFYSYSTTGELGRQNLDQWDGQNEKICLIIQAEMNNHKVRPEFTLTGIKYDFLFPVGHWRRVFSV